MKALVIAENEKAARELGAGARGMADDVTLVTFSDGDWSKIADSVKRIAVPAENVLDDAYLTVNEIADALNPSVILIEPTTRLLSIAGRLAAHLKTAVITDAIAIKDGVATSLFFGGAGERTTRSASNVSIYTIGSGIFDAAGASGDGEIVEVAFKTPENAIKRVGSEELAKADVNLDDAAVIVAAGRGFSEKDQLNLARNLCAKIGGELGCTRPLTEGVDWMPREAYIGVSGLILAPKVYVACGISGQMQHMVGCNRATTLFAINKDKNAPIFKQCDYGLIGTVEDVLPALTQQL